MPILPGMRLTEQRLNRLRPEIYSATSTTDLTVTGVTTTIPGCEITFTSAASGRVLVDGAANFLIGSTTLTANAFCSVQLTLDGATVPGFGRWGDVTAGGQGTPSQRWDITGLTAGTHTLRLSAARTAGTVGTVTAVATHCRLLAEVYEQIT
ncbi:hypothetical protein ACIBKZ_09805 [Streptomyces sp. NPDC050421]|uniref:hypothetical protein n=1 Tax=Streptomyces sp. NPDC050421 TaxID=3365613 RepID=UPI00379625AF